MLFVEAFHSSRDESGMPGVWIAAEVLLIVGIGRLSEVGANRQSPSGISFGLEALANNAPRLAIELAVWVPLTLWVLLPVDSIYQYRGGSRLSGGYSSPNVFGLSMGTAALSALWRANEVLRGGIRPGSGWTAKHGKRLCFSIYGAAIVATCYGLLESLSRGAWLATIVGGAAMAFGLVGWRRIWMIVALAPLLYLAAQTHGVAGRRFEGTLGPFDFSVSNRWDVLREGVAAAIHAPWSGWGYTGYYEVFYQWFASTDRLESDAIRTNGWLAFVLAMGSLAGVLMILWVSSAIVAGIALVNKRIRGRQGCTVYDSLYLPLVLASVVGIGCDGHLEHPAVGIPLFWSVSMLLRVGIVQIQPPILTSPYSFGLAVCSLWLPWWCFGQMGAGMWGPEGRYTIVRSGADILRISPVQDGRSSRRQIVVICGGLVDWRFIGRGVRILSSMGFDVTLVGRLSTVVSSGTVDLNWSREVLSEMIDKKGLGGVLFVDSFNEYNAMSEAVANLKVVERSLAEMGVTTLRIVVGGKVGSGSQRIVRTSGEFSSGGREVLIHDEVGRFGRMSGGLSDSAWSQLALEFRYYNGTSDLRMRRAWRGDEELDGALNRYLLDLVRWEFPRGANRDFVIGNDLGWGPERGGWRYTIWLHLWPRVRWMDSSEEGVATVIRFVCSDFLVSPNLKSLDLWNTWSSRRGCEEALERVAIAGCRAVGIPALRACRRGRIVFLSRDGWKECRIRAWLGEAEDGD